MEETNKIAAPLGVIIITGFLGAGKTTLLQSILKQNNNKRRIAVIENEFAVAYGIETEFLAEQTKQQREKGTYDEIYEFSNGCVCCSMKGEFLNSLYRLAEKRSELDLLIVELTGLADPTPISAMFLEEDLKDKFVLEGIVTVVDSKYFISQFEHGQKIQEKAKEHSSGSENIKNEALAQVLVGDIILLNKKDLVSGEEMLKLKEVISKINPLATYFETERSNIDIEKLLSLKSQLSQRLANLDLTPSIHDRSIQSFCAVASGEINLEKLKSFLQSYTSEHSQHVLRIKGFIYETKNPNVVLIQGVHTLVNYYQGRPIEKEEEKMNKLVFIGYKLARETIEGALKSAVVNQ